MTEQPEAARTFKHNFKLQQQLESGRNNTEAPFLKVLYCKIRSRDEDGSADCCLQSKHSVGGGWRWFLLR